MLLVVEPSSGIICYVLLCSHTSVHRQLQSACACSAKAETKKCNKYKTVCGVTALVRRRTSRFMDVLMRMEPCSDRSLMGSPGHRGRRGRGTKANANAKPSQLTHQPHTAPSAAPLPSRPAPLPLPWLAARVTPFSPCRRAISTFAIAAILFAFSAITITVVTLPGGWGQPSTDAKGFVWGFPGGREGLTSGNNPNYLKTPQITTHHGPPAQ